MPSPTGAQEAGPDYSRCSRCGRTPAEAGRVSGNPPRCDDCTWATLSAPEKDRHPWRNRYGWAGGRQPRNRQTTIFDYMKGE